MLTTPHSTPTWTDTEWPCPSAPVGRRRYSWQHWWRHQWWSTMAKPRRTTRPAPVAATARRSSCRRCRKGRGRSLATPRYSRHRFLWRWWWDWTSWRFLLTGTMCVTMCALPWWELLLSRPPVASECGSQFSWRSFFKASEGETNVVSFDPRTCDEHFRCNGHFWNSAMW